MLKEIDQWEELHPAEPVADPEEVERIFGAPEMRRRCVPSRACYRDKSCVVGALAAKAAPVILGVRDQDLRSVKRNASAVRRVTLFCILPSVSSTPMAPGP